MYHTFLSRIKRVSLTKGVAGFCEFFIDLAFSGTFVAFHQRMLKLSTFHDTIFQLIDPPVTNDSKRYAFNFRNIIDTQII